MRSEESRTNEHQHTNTSNCNEQLTDIFKEQQCQSYHLLREWTGQTSMQEALIQLWLQFGSRYLNKVVECWNRTRTVSFEVPCGAIRATQRVSAVTKKLEQLWIVFNQSPKGRLALTSSWSHTFPSVNLTLNRPDLLLVILSACGGVISTVVLTRPRSRGVRIRRWTNNASTSIGSSLYRTQSKIMNKGK